MDCSGWIEIQGLEVNARIGVPEQERDIAQRLLLDVSFVPEVAFSQMQDSIENTVDYFELSQRLVAFCEERPRKLIESLALECAELLLSEYPVLRVRLRIRKFILKNTEFVAAGVELCRPQPTSTA